MEGLAAVSAWPKAETSIAHGSFHKVSPKVNEQPQVDAPAVCEVNGADVVSMVVLLNIEHSKRTAVNGASLSTAVVRLNENNFNFGALRVRKVQTRRTYRQNRCFVSILLRTVQKRFS